jgi:hypothetical protein
VDENILHEVNEDAVLINEANNAVDSYATIDKESNAKERVAKERVAKERVANERVAYKQVEGNLNIH